MTVSQMQVSVTLSCVFWDAPELGLPNSVITYCRMENRYSSQRSKRCPVH